MFFTWLEINILLAHPHETRRLYRQIADQLRRAIEAGEYAIGARLPAERDLSLQLGVSRPSVREALIALEVEGWVEVRMGSGVYVLPQNMRRQRSPVLDQSPFEVLQARQMIEGELAALAAQHMRPADLMGLREALELMREDMRKGLVPTRGDRLFHVRLAAGSGNQVFVRMVGELFDERENDLYQQFQQHAEEATYFVQITHEHQAVIDAIAVAAPARAREAMRRHLQVAQDRYAGEWTEAGNAWPLPGGI